MCRVFDEGNERRPISDAPPRSTHWCDLICPLSRIPPAVFVPACVAPMAFPICRGRPPGLEEHGKIRRPDKIKKKKKGYFWRILQVVDLWLGDILWENSFNAAPCSSEVITKRFVAMRSNRTTSKNSVWFFIILALNLEVSATTAVILGRQGLLTMFSQVCERGNAAWG